MLPDGVVNVQGPGTGWRLDPVVPCLRVPERPGQLALAGRKGRKGDLRVRARGLHLRHTRPHPIGRGDHGDALRQPAKGSPDCRGVEAGRRCEPAAMVMVRAGLRCPVAGRARRQNAGGEQGADCGDGAEHHRRRRGPAGRQAAAAGLAGTRHVHPASRGLRASGALEVHAQGRLIHGHTSRR